MCYTRQNGEGEGAGWQSIRRVNTMYLQKNPSRVMGGSPHGEGESTAVQGRVGRWEGRVLHLHRVDYKVFVVVVMGFNVGIKI